ncbi:hypothetical protein HPB47_023902 [Ixodes persulcatus]|uniref:Uncharacterized protein n=1 Tax=Ixodes persulcatus TaxID=34615 RepID=A0AC60Q616_IXOPE|nr:hypothetical protein HPB47_023902 [Ixodes persulcatus]
MGHIRKECLRFGYLREDCVRAYAAVTDVTHRDESHDFKMNEDEAEATAGIEGREKPGDPSGDVQKDLEACPATEPAEANVLLEALRWVILSDSRSALELLSRLERATPLARSIAQDAVELQQKGNDLVFQWLTSHCGIRGNEVVDFLAMRAHKDPECPLSTVPRFSDAKLLLGYHAAWISHFRLNVDPICQTCEETADGEHLFLQCTDHEEERTNLCDAFSHLGLPSTNLEELLRPRASRATTDKALKSVVSFLRSTELLEIL